MAAATAAEAVPPASAPPAAADSVAAAFKRLQNGSDIRGVAMALAPEDAVTLTPATVFFIGQAFVDFLHKRGVEQPTVAVGCDPRVTAPLLVPAVLAGVLRAGGRVLDAGLATTPAMFFSLIMPGAEAAGSVMMTASHMPMQNNGLKFFTAAGGLEKQDIARILELAAAKCAAAGAPLGGAARDAGFVLSQALLAGGAPASRWPLLEAYAAELRRQLRDKVAHPEHPEQPLRGVKIAVDAGNGSGGFFATQVLEPLGADISGSQFLDPDGTFPNHIPNPENKAAMAAAVDAVKRSGADLGIVFDTDVDRSAIVSGGGEPINSNRFIALMAAIVLQEHPGSTIVTDSVTSNGLTQFIEKRGGKHFRFQRGYRNVINKGVELNKQGVDCELMMETSGHGAMRSNRYLDDGCHLALTAIVALMRSRLAAGGGGGLSELLADLQEPADSAEYRIAIKGNNFKAVGASVLERFREWVAAGAGGAPNWSPEPVNHEGWRVAVDEGGGRRGWLLLRQSLHDPLLVLNVESDTPNGVAAIRQHVLGFLTQPAHASSLDLSKLQQ